MKSAAVLLLCLMVAAAVSTTRGARTPSSTQAVVPPNPEFLKAADEVLAQMSQILHLPIREPLKKSLRSKQEIRDYIVRDEKEDLTDAERYADDRTTEAFGLIPKGFPLDSFMLDVLTDQVAGLYDPKGKEFYIADWIPADQQREVMAHELTHALEDQSFHIDPWIKAARPNIDAEEARQAVSEGSALAAMVDYSLRDQKVGVRDLPNVGMMIRSGAVAEMDKDPTLAKAPGYIRDSLLFPYLAGTDFSQQFLKAHSGWQDLNLLFKNPPVSTQQIMHPALYLTGVLPREVTLPEWKGLAPANWKFLEENVLGEFSLNEVLKQFLGEQAANELAPMWTGDRYATFEDAESKQTRLVLRLDLDSPEDAARFFGRYSELLELKYKERHDLLRRPNYFEFQTDDGGVFVRCINTECLTVENSTRAAFDAIDRAIGWPPAPSDVAPAASIAQVTSPYVERSRQATGIASVTP
jgi:hypothetical protein